ncbi:hypothetical protein ACIQRS_01750 [Streptomyces termitum]|uniref:Uncharacterized protein n=1 Tax=Streptomyces termitum TaxID=67368 RepID=A0A918SXE0_9ACTN|nr:hypothetical protein [Streptomyces termitum]GHA73779.1 hypothetical protein GCM10010305_15490 [Streptomyces termitum]
MAFISKKTPEQQAQATAEKERKRQEAAERQRAEQAERDRKAFLSTPVGRARQCFEQGDLVYQCSIDVMSQQAVIVAMVGSTTLKQTTDPVAVLNAVCREGWELVNGSFVFVEQGQQSRDKFMTSGQNVAVKGETVGYYLFKRREANRKDS